MTPAVLRRCRLFLRFEHSSQFRRERKNSAFTVLGRARVESHLAGLHVHLPPFQRQDLAGRAPARDMGKFHDRPHVDRQMVLEALKLLGLEEPFPHVVLFQQRDIGPDRELPPTQPGRADRFSRVD